MELRVEKNSSTSSFKKLPGGFLIALMFIVVFEFANDYFDNYFYSPREEGVGQPFEGLRIKIKNEISQSRENNFDILILGDSHSHVSIKPKIIEEKTGRSCFNFSTFGWQGTIGSYWFFKNYLDSHVLRPKYLIVAYSFLTAYPEEFTRDMQIINLYDLRKGNILAYMEEFGFIPGIKFIFPSLKHQGRFKEFIKSPFSFKMPTKKQLDDFIMQVYLDKGHYPLRVEKVFSPEAKESGYKKFFEYANLDNFKISPFALKYLRRSLDLAKKYNIKIIYEVQPLPPYLYNKISRYNYLKQYNDFIDSLKKDYPDIIVINPQNILDSDDMYMDRDHLNGKGAPILSEFLAQKINELNRQD